MSTSPPTSPPLRGSASAWHDAECGDYSDDLPIWRRLAAAAGGGAIVELGAGTGRVALTLAAEGHRVVAIERERDLLRALRARARSRGLEVATICADALDPWGARLTGTPLVLAPMQFLHLPEPGERPRLLAAAAAALSPGGSLAAALLDDRVPMPEGAPEPIPDIRERAGWVHSSLPTEIRRTPGGVELDRLRQLVSPQGRLTEWIHTERLHELTPARLAAEAAEHGLRERERIEVSAGGEHVGSMIVVLEAPR